jgi:hypothetical protein
MGAAEAKLYIFLTLEVDGGASSASRPDRLFLRETGPGIRCTGVWEGGVWHIAKSSFDWPRDLLDTAYNSLNSTLANSHSLQFTTQTQSRFGLSFTSPLVPGSNGGHSTCGFPNCLRANIYVHVGESNLYSCHSESHKVTISTQPPPDNLLFKVKTCNFFEVIVITSEYMYFISWRWIRQVLSKCRQFSLRIFITKKIFFPLNPVRIAATQTPPPLRRPILLRRK